MSALKVGDICIGQHFVVDVHRNGMECVIVGGLEFTVCTDTRGYIVPGDSYLVEWSDGVVVEVGPHNLRKKRPPQSDETWAADMVKKVTGPVPELTERIEA